ncbi:hypothetical protein [Clostridium ljungdahlii]|uniref:Uncharacterized protein n=1 Tax=Clostridium ljungdahlii TaxID=1538 RepID=A0A170NKL6_9CLOT|nr:hypothetical protein [Clostridium ljungdahlii]OAA91244.1 hypothetical protein WY13_00809 [Clostridium ljungdahlii]
MTKRLTGGAGTGKKIIKNLDLFKHSFNKVDEEGNYIFNVSFGKQSGNFVISYNEDGVIDERSTLNMKDLDKKTLEIYNDPSLREVAEMLMNDYESNKDENENN